MIWLASFPRSGNTFFRNILFEVYGISSNEYFKDAPQVGNSNQMSCPVMKTHHLPSELPTAYRDCKSVYLVRDGRDALVSIAHHRKDIVAPGSNYLWNLTEAILAQKGSFFGGWGGNVDAWLSKADIVIKYEDLIKNPLEEVAKLNQIMDLPPPDKSKLPSFKSLKSGKATYNGTDLIDDTNIDKVEFSNIFFRKGKTGSYKDEMPYMLRILFWLKNRKQMNQLNYY